MGDIQCKLIDQSNIFGEVLSAAILITGLLYGLSLTPVEMQTYIRRSDAEQEFESFLDLSVTRTRQNRYYDYFPTLFWNPQHHKSPTSTG